MKIQCYNCGKYFEKKETNKEHIPAQAMFNGYDEKYKINRITVRSCINCNNSYSKIDEEFRNMIGIMNNDKTRKTLSEKSAKSIIKIKKQFHRIVTDIYGSIKGIEFNQSDINKFHIKNFKGIYYKKYNKVITEKDYNFIPFTEPSNFTYSLLHYLTDNFKWKVSGHRDIFGYIIQPFSNDIKDAENLKQNENDKIILACMDYNKSHMVIVAAIKKTDYNEKLLQNS